MWKWESYRYVYDLDREWCTNCNQELLLQWIDKPYYYYQIQVIDAYSGTSLLHYAIRDLMGIFRSMSEEYMQ